MQLKLKTDYALRVLLYLAHRDALAGDAAATPDPVSTEAVAKAFAISRDHVVKVVQELAHLGWVSTHPGRGGGIELAVDPASLRIDEVVAAFESRAGVLECIERPSVCVLEPGCDLRRLLMDAETAFYDVLAGRTVADLVSRRPRRGGVHNLHVAPPRRGTR